MKYQESWPSYFSILFLTAANTKCFKRGDFKLETSRKQCPVFKSYLLIPLFPEFVLNLFLGNLPH